MGKSALLLFLSDFKEGRTETEYKLEKKTYKGVQTNDAPAKALFSMAVEDSNKKSGNSDLEPITKVFCIVSKQVFETKKALRDDSSELVTQFDRYQSVVQAFVDKELKEDYVGRSVDFFPIYYEFDKDRKTEEKSGKQYEKKSNDEDVIMSVYQQLTGVMSRETVSDVYIDYTGGFRDISLLMTTIIRYLRFSEVHLRKILYSNMDGSMHDLGYIDEMFQMIEAVNNFVTTGSARQLKNVFQEGKYWSGADEEKESGQRSDTSAVLKSLMRFSDAVLICDINSIGDAVADMQNSLNQLEVSQDQNLFSEMLRTLIPAIRKKMYMQQLGTVAAGSADVYPRLILWSLDNWMLQQAATLYVEKMPSFYRQCSGISYVEHWFPTKFYNGAVNEWNSGTDSEIFYKKLFGECYEHAVPDVINGFQGNIRNVLNQWNNRGTADALSRLSVLLDAERMTATQNDYYDQARALLRLKEYVDQWDISGQPGPIYGMSLQECETTESLLTKLAERSGYLHDGEVDKNKLYRHYFLFEGMQHVQDAARIQASYTYGDNYSYRRKIVSLENIADKKGNCTTGKWASVLRLMQYYLAGKLIRNRMNHASESAAMSNGAARSEKECDEKALTDYLNGVGIVVDNDTDHIRKVLYDGVRISNPELFIA